MTKVVLFSLFASACFAIPAKAEDPLKIEVAVKVPATNFKVQIEEVRKVGEELWVLSRVFFEEETGGDLVIEVRDSVFVRPVGFPVKHFVMGSEWSRTDPKKETYLPKERMSDEEWKGAEVIWKRAVKRE